MTENIWKIFAPWRGPQLKLLFSTFFQVTVYLVDTQNFRVSWRPLHVFCEYLCKYWSYLIQKNIWHNLLGIVYRVKKVSTIFDQNWSHNINLKKKCSISWKVIWKPIVHWRHSFSDILIMLIEPELKYVWIRHLCPTRGARRNINQNQIYHEKLHNPGRNRDKNKSRVMGFGNWLEYSI